MIPAEFKKITQDKKQYLVSCHQYSSYTTHEAWEPAEKDDRGFLTGGTHYKTYIGIPKELWGDIMTRVFPERIQMMTPMSSERRIKEQQFIADCAKLVESLVYAAFKVKPPFLIYRDKPIELKEEKSMENKRSPLTKKIDPEKEKIANIVKKILEVADFNRLKQLAKLNSVMIKDSDTVGLLKMRVMNAFRTKLGKGEMIVET